MGLRMRTLVRLGPVYPAGDSNGKRARRSTRRSRPLSTRSEGSVAIPAGIPGRRVIVRAVRSGAEDHALGLRFSKKIDELTLGYNPSQFPAERTFEARRSIGHRESPNNC